MRIVVDGQPDAAGALRGALEIRLEPGWKTYWRDPGEAGIPPTVTVVQPADGGGVEIGFPAPRRFDDGYSVWAGYNQSVALPLTFTLPPGTSGVVTVSAFLGICEIICIPVQADFTFDLASSADADRATVEAAFDALPGEAKPGFRATLAKSGKDSLTVRAELPPDSAPAELFVASTENWAFGVPKLLQGGGGATFDIPVLFAPEGNAAPETVHYTLVAGGVAVAETLQIDR